MRLSGFQALSFDCYGTLIGWETGISAVLLPWVRAQGLDVDEERLLSAYGQHETWIEAQTPTALYPDVVAHSMMAVGQDFGVPARLGSHPGTDHLGHAGLRVHFNAVFCRGLCTGSRPLKLAVFGSAVPGSGSGVGRTMGA